MRLADVYPADAFVVPGLPRLPDRVDKTTGFIERVGDTFKDSFEMPPYRPPKKRRKKKASASGTVTKPRLEMPEEKKAPQHRFSLFKDNTPKKKPKAQTSRLRVR